MLGSLVSSACSPRHGRRGRAAFACVEHPLSAGEVEHPLSAGEVEHPLSAGHLYRPLSAGDRLLGDRPNGGPASGQWCPGVSISVLRAAGLLLLCGVAARLAGVAGRNRVRRGPPGYESDWCENRNSRIHPDLRVSRCLQRRKLNLHVAHVAHVARKNHYIFTTLLGGSIPAWMPGATQKWA
jgi:hypothetical protein